jgi:hypothetical protein
MLNLDFVFLDNLYIDNNTVNINLNTNINTGFLKPLLNVPQETCIKEPPC